MPVEAQLSPWNEALLQLAQERRGVVGFDGPFTLPSEERVLLEIAYAARQAEFVRIVRHLNLDHAAARTLYFSLIRVPEAESVAQVDEFIQALQRG